MTDPVDKLVDNIKNIDLNEKIAFGEFIKQRYTEEMKKNDEIVKVAIDKKYKDLLKKITNHMEEKMLEDERTQFDIEQVLTLMKENALVRSFFRKDPIKQNFHEDQQIEWLRRHKYNSIVCLPKTTTNGYYLSKKKIQTGRKALPAETKTFDFVIEDKKIYGVLKYTTDKGGAQDNQYNDVKKFIEKMIEFYDSNEGCEEKFEIYLDGTYYTENKFKELKDMIPEKYQEKILVNKVANI